MKLVVATHGHCFDGLASAVVFTRLYQHLRGAAAELRYRACGYGAQQLRADASVLTGDDNAILDYRFFPAERLGWYFDHHRTAFASEADRDQFEAWRGARGFHFQPSYSSCTKLIADVAQQDHGLDLSELTELIQLADTVDAARFTSAAAATNRDTAVMQLVGVTEHYGDDRFLARLVPALLQQPLHVVAASPFIQQRWAPLAAKHERFVARVRSTARAMGRVVYVDLTGQLLETVGKFVTYALYPESLYSVVVGRLPGGVRISVGFNPWHGAALDRDISAICARHGGGGHPFVGGISFPPHELEHAQAVGLEIARELDR